MFPGTDRWCKMFANALHVSMRTERGGIDTSNRENMSKSFPYIRAWGFKLWLSSSFSFLPLLIFPVIDLLRQCHCCLDLLKSSAEWHHDTVVPTQPCLDKTNIASALLIWSSVMCVSISLSVHLCFSLKLYKAFTGSEASSGKDNRRVLPKDFLTVFDGLYVCMPV